MKDSYIEDRFNRYMLFGGNDSRVDVGSLSKITIASGSMDDMQWLVDDRNILVDMVVRLAHALDEVDHQLFNRIWY